MKMEVAKMPCQISEKVAKKAVTTMKISTPLCQNHEKVAKKAVKLKFYVSLPVKKRKNKLRLN